MKSELTRARKALDKKFNFLRQADSLTPPSKGWVRAIRDAIGMSGAQLAQRLKITPQSLSGLEKSEANQTIRLETLRKAASALQCRLVYVLVPNEPLENIVSERARRKVLKSIRGISHSMALEDQEVHSDDLEERIQTHIVESLNERDLWED